MDHAEYERPNQQLQTLHIDHDAYEVILDGNPIHLTRAEFTLLTTFVDSPRQALSSHYLMQVLTDNGWLSEIYSLRMLVSRLRTKLGESGNQFRRIVTVHGYGYRFEPDTATDLATAMASKSQIALGNLSTSAFALVSLARNILWASDSFMQVLGWQPSDLIGMSLYELMHPDDKPSAMSGRKDLDQGIPAAFFLHLRNNTGQYRLVEALARPILDHCGHVICFLGEYRPATAAQKAELALPNPIYIGRSETRDQRYLASASGGRIRSHRAH